MRSVFAADPTTFAPYDTNASDDYVASSLMYASLVYKDEGNKIVPGIADSFCCRVAGEYTSGAK